MTPGLFEHHRLIIFHSERGLEVHLFLLKQPLFFSSGILPGPAFTDAPVKLGAVMASSADISLHGAEGGEGISLDLITSWLYQLSTGLLFKRSH